MYILYSPFSTKNLADGPCGVQENLKYEVQKSDLHVITESRVVFLFFFIQSQGLKKLEFKLAFGQAALKCCPGPEVMDLFIYSVYIFIRLSHTLYFFQG